MTLKEHYKKNIVLAYPVIIGQLGHIMVGVADTMMVGHVGVIPLAAATFAGTIFFVMLLFGVGTSYAITPLVAAADPKDQSSLMNYLQSSMFVNVVVSILLCFLGLFLSNFLMYFGQEETVAQEAEPYLVVMCVSLIPLMVFQTHRQFREGLSDTFNPMVVSVIANLLNVGLNYVLIYGAFGIAPMGLLGAGYATLISRIVMAILMWMFIRKMLVGFRWSYDGARVRQMLKIGLPTGMQYVFEVGAFAVASIMVGWISAEMLAAHQIALNITAVTYMCATGLAAAATVRIGNQKGLGSLRDLRLAGVTSFVMVGVFMSCTAVCFFIFREFFVSLYIKDEYVQSIAVSVMLIAGAFQLSDGLQAVGLGVLRGMTDIKFPTWVTFISFWCIAIPSGYVFGFVFELGIEGIWYGLLLGLSVAAIFHMLRFRELLRRMQKEAASAGG
ncbi:MAG: MATE family efflux transporter [Cyclobacteriaceae bacterium]